MRSHQGSVLSLVGVGCLCLAASGCADGAEKGENEQFGSSTQAVLASECVDEAAAFGWRVILKRWTGSWLPDLDIGGGSSNDPGAFTDGTGSALAGRKHVAVRQGNNAFDGFWAKYK